MKTKRLFYLIAVATVFAVACGSNEDKKAVPPPETTAEVVPDSTVEEMPDTVLSRETIDTFSTMAFTTHAKKQTKAFDWSRFRMEQNWIDSSPRITSFIPDKQFLDAYGRFVKYSPDSSMFVDLDSYSFQIKKDGKGQWQGTSMDPEQEIGLVNLKTGKKTRLLYLGPGRSVEDALWLDNDNLALIGVDESIDNSSKVASVWKVNIPTNSFYQYELKDSVAARKILGTWRKERLKGVVMN